MILAGQIATEEDVARFYTEAEAAATLEHPGIVPIHEIGQHNSHHYFSMRFVGGRIRISRASVFWPAPCECSGDEPKKELIKEGLESEPARPEPPVEPLPLKAFYYTFIQFPSGISKN